MMFLRAPESKGSLHTETPSYHWVSKKSLLLHSKIVTRVVDIIGKDSIDLVENVMLKSWLISCRSYRYSDDDILSVDHC